MGFDLGRDIIFLTEVSFCLVFLVIASLISLDQTAFLTALFPLNDF